MGTLFHDKTPLGTVLVIEDDSSLSAVLKTALEREGFKVITATAAPEAITKIRNQAFDCIVLDMELARGTGEDVINTLISINPHSLIPVVVTSGTLDVALVKRIRMNVKDVLVKPYDVKTVVSKVQAKIR